MPTFAGSLASVDGAITLASTASIPATDEGLVRGDGVFDVVRIYDGRPFAFDEHLKRLERSALNLRLPLDLEAVRADANRLLAHAGPGPDHALLRIVITRGGRRLMLTESLPDHPDHFRLASITYSPPLVLDGVKSLSYAANMHASRLARERGCDEAVLVNPEGWVLEAPTSAIFWVEGDTLLTPPLSDHILASITRRIVIEQAGAVERSCTLEQLLAADEAFLASTVREVHPISAIDDRSYAAPGPVTTATASTVGSWIASELAATA